MSDHKNIEFADEDGSANADSVSDPGEEPEMEGVSESEATEHPQEGVSSLSGEAELKARSEFPLDNRY